MRCSESNTMSREARRSRGSRPGVVAALDIGETALVDFCDASQSANVLAVLQGYRVQLPKLLDVVDAICMELRNTRVQRLNVHMKRLDALINVHTSIITSKPISRQYPHSH